MNTLMHFKVLDYLYSPTSQLSKENEFPFNDDFWQDKKGKYISCYDNNQFILHNLIIIAFYSDDHELSLFLAFIAPLPSLISSWLVHRYINNLENKYFKVRHNHIFLKHPFNMYKIKDSPHVQSCQIGFEFLNRSARPKKRKKFQDS